VYLLLAFTLGIAAISIRSAQNDRPGLSRLPLFCLCALVAVAYYGSLRLV
jgi:hypothetical protein